MFTANTSKSTAALLSGGFGSAVSTILIWIINAQMATPMPDTIQVAVGVVITGLIAYVATYLSPANTSS